MPSQTSFGGGNMLRGLLMRRQSSQVSTAAAAAAALAYGSRSPGQNNNSNSRRESLAQMHHHLPNPLKGIIGEAAAAADDSYEYDRKILQAAAMMDGNKQQQTRPNVK